MRLLDTMLTQAVNRLNRSENPLGNTSEKEAQMASDERTGARQLRSFKIGLTVLGCLVLQHPEKLKGIPGIPPEFVEQMLELGNWGDPLYLNIAPPHESWYKDADL